LSVEFLLFPVEELYFLFDSYSLCFHFRGFRGGGLVGDFDPGELWNYLLA
jgi:hypothetical protein